MRKEDKGTIIAQIAETVKEYSCFYLAERYQNDGC